MSKGLLCFALLGVVASGYGQEQRVQAKVELDELLDLYLSYGLPVPPADSELVWMRTSLLANPGGREYYTLAFANALENGKTEFYFGTRIRVWTGETPIKFTTIANAPGPTHYVVAHRPGNSQRDIIAEDILIALAMQAHALGKTEFAQVLLDRGVPRFVTGSGGFPDEYALRDDARPDQRIAHVALHSATNDWAFSGSDPVNILARIERARDSGYIRRGHYGDILRENLLRAAEPFPKPRNRAQFLVSMLADGTGSGWTRTHKDESGPAAELKALGDGALPDLANYIGNERPTRMYSLAVRKNSAHYWSVGDVVSEIISEIADDPVFEGRRRLTPADVKAHLELRRTGDRSRFLTQLLLPPSTGPKDDWPDVASNYYAAQEMLQNDLKRFEKVYLEFATNYPHVVGMHSVLYASDLPVEHKHRMYLAAARAPILYHAVNALDDLRKLDETEFHLLLPQKIRAMPTNDLNRGGFNSASKLAELVAFYGNADEWKLLEEIIPTLRPSTRAMMLTEMVNLWLQDKHPQEQRMLSLMKEFFDDAGVPRLENAQEYRYINERLFADSTLTVGDLLVLRVHYYFTRTTIHLGECGPDPLSRIRKAVDEEMLKRGFDR